MILALLFILMGAAQAQAQTQPAPAEVQVEQPVHHARKKAQKPPMAGVLNLNRATVAELRLLPGVGKRRAEMIVERREKKPFTTVDEVGRIKGLHALVQRLRPHLAVTGDTTLHPLTAAVVKR
ncbi:MAG TPA: helix-hairpin-helix domain-containing protein [Myxococcales bacterium]|jgi:DNA uptake protein ComE-like DNA-binding protein